MANKPNAKLGASWEQNTIHFAQAIDGNPAKAFHVSFEPKAADDTDEINQKEWEKNLSGKIKSALKEQGISANAVFLSLPTSDIIFRSFVIPWMQPHEVKNVVEFEVSKYIPFSLSELSYSYHPINIHITGVRQIRIIFTAIKLDALDAYERILKSAGLSARIIEPSALSLIRALCHKDILPPTDTVAIIEKGDSGRIIISHAHTPQFVREFFLPSPTEEAETDGLDETAKKLAKEVRVSLDYFKRQNEQLSVSKIFYLSPFNEGELSKTLEDYVGIPIETVNSASLLGTENKESIANINAYGSSLTPISGKSVSFNLSKASFQADDADSGLSFDFKRLTKKQWILLTIFICAPIVLASATMSILWKRKINNERAQLTGQLGKFNGSDVAFIKQKEDLLSKKYLKLKNTRTISDVYTYLLMIPELLPEETWLKSLDILYFEDEGGQNTLSRRRAVRRVSDGSKKEDIPKMILTLDGYAYSENKGEQFKIVNNLMSKLKDSEKFTSFFQSIKLDTITAQNLSGFDVTYFKIVCKQSNEAIRPQ